MVASNWDRAGGLLRRLASPADDKSGPHGEVAVADLRVICLTDNTKSEPSFRSDLAFLYLFFPVLFPTLFFPFSREKE
jgi:hypothetical protein